jgi:glutaconyl-CoA/methylmalonyl-CoA decarboxylase subunit gamma
VNLTLTINGEEHALEWTPGEVLLCEFDGSPFETNAREIAPGLFSILIAGRQFCARVSRGPDPTDAVGNAYLYKVQVDGETYSITAQDPRRWSRARSGVTCGGHQQIVAPMPGKIVRVLVAPGQQVEAGRSVIVVEAMKMQNEIRSSTAGTVARVSVSEGQAVNAGEILMTIE